MRYYLIAPILMSFLTACSAAPSEPIDVCPPVKQYNKPTQFKMRSELAQCNCPTVIEAMKDYKVARDQSRACNNTKKEKING